MTGLKTIISQRQNEKGMDKNDVVENVDAH
jgi:hypothetical protein